MLMALKCFVFLLLPVVSARPTERDIGPVTIWNPDSDYADPGSLYGRHLLLQDGQTMLATSEAYLNQTRGLSSFLIFKSTDGGQNWNEISKIEDTQNGVGLTFQPFLYQLKNDYGCFSAGTILCAGNSANFSASVTYSTQLDLYASEDEGYTWTFISHMTDRSIGNDPNTDQGDPTPVWESFFLEYEGSMYHYYSDERDPAHNQKLVYQASSDLTNWGPVTGVVVDSNSNARPGMAIISKFPGGYFLSYEICNGPAGQSACGVNYRVADSPLEFDKQPDTVVLDVNGNQPSSSPYNVWSSAGGENGTLVLNAYSSHYLFVNKNLGRGKWSVVQAPVDRAYTRSLSVGPADNHVNIVGGGLLGKVRNKLTYGSVDL